jgi:hypothetical protein
VPEEIIEEGLVEAIPEQEAPMPQEVVLVDAEPEMPRLCLYHARWRDYEEHPLRMVDDFDDLGDDPNEGCLTWMSCFPKMEVMIGIESLSLNLKIRIKNKFFGFA